MIQIVCPPKWRSEEYDFMSSGNNLIFWMVIIFLCAINLLVTRVWNSPQALSSFQSRCQDGNRRVWGGDSPGAHGAGRKVLTQPCHTSLPPESRKLDEEGGWGKHSYMSKGFSLFLAVARDRLLFYTVHGVLMASLLGWFAIPSSSGQCVKKQSCHFANKGPYSQGYGLSSSHVQMWELDHKEIWALKNWCFWTVVLEKTLESPLDFKEIKPVHP